MPHLLAHLPVRGTFCGSLELVFAASAASEQHLYTGAPPGVPAVPQAEVRDGRVGRVRLAAVGVWGLAPMSKSSGPPPRRLGAATTLF